MRHRNLHDYFPVAWALKQTLRKGYHRQDLKGDISAALVVSMISVPLSMALAIAVGLPPQHGLITAVIGGIAAALLGGSRFQISGPTAAFVVVLIPIVAEFGLRGLIWCQILAGLILISFAFAKLGRLINYVPYPVTTGFTTGIACVLAIIALKDFLGLSASPTAHHLIDKIYAIATQLPQTNWAAVSVGVFTLALMITSKKTIRTIPSPIIGVVGGSLLGYALFTQGIPIPTIGSEFNTMGPASLSQEKLFAFLPHLGLPTFSPNQLLTIPTMQELKAFFMPAMIIATLAALESLLSANIADNLTGTRHHSNAELNGIGIANILSGLATGIPATAAIARTATNIHNGARTPLSGVFNGILILIYTVCLAPLIAWIPMAVLAALLLMTAYHVSHIRQFINILRIAPKSDKSVLCTCFVFTVFVDMVAGVTLGILLAVILFLKRVAETTQIHLSFFENRALKTTQAKLPDNVMWFQIDGPLFFGTVEKAYDRTQVVHPDIDTIIIDMEKVPYIDMTGIIAMQSMLRSMIPNRTVYLCGKKEVIATILRKLPVEITHKIKTYAKANDIEIITQYPYHAIIDIE